ncbi:hypothetical protein ACWERA_54050, partial [Streptomyces mirabilis]
AALVWVVVDAFRTTWVDLKGPAAGSTEVTGAPGPTPPGPTRCDRPRAPGHRVSGARVLWPPRPVG